MSLAHDLDQILETVLPNDPSFRTVEASVLNDCIQHVRHCAQDGARDAFLLSAMRLLALAGNGHTRLIPNDAIDVLPLRFVSVGRAVHLVGTSPELTAPHGELVAVNGVDVAQIDAKAAAFLAGTPQRKRVIGPILLAWPYALKKLGISSTRGVTDYHVRDETGQVTVLKIPNGHRVAGTTLYPRNEHGRADPTWEPETFVEMTDWQGLGLCITLPSFFDPRKTELQSAIFAAAEHVRAASPQTLLIDVRGNTGGNFLMTMPLINAISERENLRVTLLVDKFTFSAAIVFVAILKQRLGDRLTLVGEEMGDRLTFFAEGGLLDLPSSGAVVRYSTAFHDWKTGATDETTPPEIARHVVPVGELNLDVAWAWEPADQNAPGALYQRILDRIATARASSGLRT